MTKHTTAEITIPIVRTVMDIGESYELSSAAGLNGSELSGEKWGVRFYIGVIIGGNYCRKYYKIQYILYNC